jgi:hypothetical protein
MVIKCNREQVLVGLIKLKKNSNRRNIADMLTKLIVGKTFTRKKAMHLLGKMGLELEPEYEHNLTNVS